MSTDSTITTSDTLIAINSIPGIQAGFNLTVGTFTHPNYITLPGYLSPGTYFIGVVADYNSAMVETSETDNASPGIAITVTAGRPDLDIYFTPIVSSTTVSAGGHVTFTFDLDNLGGSASVSSTTGIYLSTDSTISTSDVLITTRTHPSFPGGFYQTSNVDLLLPADLAPGTYYVGGIADYANLINESNEANNPSAGVAITVTAPAPTPDLAITALPSVDTTTATAGGLISYSFSVDNLGPAVASASTTGIYLSTDATVTAGDILLNSVGMASITSGGYQSAIADLVLPSNLAPGNYYIGAIADATNAVAESNEVNNSSSIVTITVTLPQADLSFVGIPIATVNSASGVSLVSYSFDLTNSGSATAMPFVGPITTEIYLSTDSTITSSDHWLTMLTTPSLAAGAHHEVASTVALPEDLAPGTYYIGAIVDSHNSVAEANDANNTSSVVAITVADSRPDLTIITPPFLTSDIVVAGNGVGFKFAISNIGSSLAAPSTTAIYLSTDATIDVTDRLLMTVDQGAIPAGSSEHDFVGIDLPSDLANGTYFIGAIVDAANAISESSEANNASIAMPVTITNFYFTEATDIATLPFAGGTWASLGGDDVVSGTAGLDIISGDGGNDTPFGGAGVDTLMGNDGNDTLVGNADIFAQEADTLIGGAGDDTIYGDFTDTIDGGDGYDVLYAVNSYPWMIDLAATGIEWMECGFGNDIVLAQNQTVAVTIYGGGGNDWFLGSGFDDNIWAGAGDDSLTGGAGNDVLFGDIGIDWLAGGDGDDLLFTDGSDIAIEGGSGFDALYVVGGSGLTINMVGDQIEWLADYVNGNDTVTAENASVDVVVYAGGGTDIITGGSGNDFLWGEAGNDTITGNGGGDTLVGGTGADILTGGLGTDVLYMNSGGLSDGALDRAVFTAGWGTDFVFDFVVGEDKLDLTALGTSFAALSITNSFGHAYITIGAGPDLIAVAGNGGLLTTDDFLF
ncbi:MAG: CARDB domain-containing protein [Hyphomicrobiaceae bacterium]